MTREQLDDLKRKIRTLKNADKKFEKMKTATEELGTGLTLTKLKSFIENVKSIIEGADE